MLDDDPLLKAAAELREVTARIHEQMAYAGLMSAITTRDVLKSLVDEIDWRGEK